MSSPAHSSRYSRTSSSPSPPPAPALSEGAASAHFLRLIGQHRPIGAHRHLNVIPILVALQTHHQEEDVDGESVRERLKELYDVDGLEDLEEIALAPLFGADTATPLSTPPPESPRLNSGLQRLPGRTTRGSTKPPAREFGLPFAQYEHLVAPRRLDPSATLLESSEGELSEEEEGAEVKEEEEERPDEIEEDEGGSDPEDDGSQEGSQDEIDEDEDEDHEGEEEEDDGDENTSKPKRTRRSGTSTARKGRSSGGASRARKSGGAAKSKTTRAAAAKKPRRSTRR